MDIKSTVYVSKEDKEALQKNCEEIEKILEKYPYSNDFSDNCVTNMTRIKTFSHELKSCIELLKIK